jgi:DNA-binding CsgD family transcriptional regulator
MGMVDELVRAREAYERREWVAAYESLASVDSLAGDDFDRLGTAAFLLARKNDCVMAYQRGYQAHLDAGDPLAAVRSAFFLALELFTSGEPAIGGGWVARAARLLDDIDGDVAERGYLLIHMMFRHIMTADWETALELAIQVTDYGRRFADADLLAMGLNARGRLATRSGQVREGLAMLDEAMVGIAAGEVSPIFAGQIYCSMIEACQELSEFGRAAEWTAALTAWCDGQPGLVSFTGQCAVHRGQIMRVRGAYTEALDEFERATRRYLDTDSPGPAGLAFCERGDVLRIIGEYAAADDCYAQAVAHGHDPQPGLALLWLARGREGAAASAVRRLLAEPRDPIGRSQILPAAVDVLLATDDTDEAGALAAEMRSIVQKLGCDALLAMAGYATGHHLLVTGEPATALGELRRASRLWAGLSAPYENARSRLLIGRALRALGDEESAVAELAAARRTFSELGATPSEHDAARLLQPEAPSGLTAREIEVLRLVSAGRTNPEIAAMLVLSEKTVARHLSNIFTKIDVTTRTAAAAFAFENRIV